jgi:hypothetical protein
MRLEQTSIGSAAKTKLFNFGALIDSFTSYAKNNSVADLIEFIINYYKYIY